MNLVLLDDGDLTADGGAVLHGARARHVHEVHRAAVGDTLRVGLLGGQVGEGVVTALAPDEVVLSVRLFSCPPAPLRIDLLLAMPRPKMLRRILAAVASLGVKRLVLINSAQGREELFRLPAHRGAGDRRTAAARPLAGTRYDPAPRDRSSGASGLSSKTGFGLSGPRRPGVSWRIRKPTAISARCCRRPPATRWSWRSGRRAAGCPSSSSCSRRMASGDCRRGRAYCASTPRCRSCWDSSR